MKTTHFLGFVGKYSESHLIIFICPTCKTNKQTLRPPTQRFNLEDSQATLRPCRLLHVETRTVYSRAFQIRFLSVSRKRASCRAALQHPLLYTAALKLMKAVLLVFHCRFTVSTEKSLKSIPQKHLVARAFGRFCSAFLDQTNLFGHRISI